MIRVPIIIVSAAVGLALGAGIVLAQGLDEIAARDSIDEAIALLQKAEQSKRFSDSGLDARRARALAYLVLARTELQNNFGRTYPLE